LEQIIPISERISIQRLKLEVESEINHLEASIGGEQIYASTFTDLYSFKHDGSGLRKILSSPEGIDQFVVSALCKKLIYLSEGEFHICTEGGQEIKTLSVEGEVVLNAINFTLFPSETKIAFVGESAEPGPGGAEISVFRICMLDLKTEKLRPLSKSFYGAVPELIGWVDEDLIILNEDTGDLMQISTVDLSEQIMLFRYSSLYEGGKVESVAVSQNGKRTVFSVVYPIERVQIFIKEEGKTKIICDLEGEGGFLRAILLSPNAQLISYVNSWFSSLALYLIPITPEKPESLEVASLGLDSNVVWLPKGDGLVYTEGNEIHILRSPDLTAR
jgi:hypothetical protein